MAAPRVFAVLDSASLSVVLECLGPREAVKLSSLSVRTRNALVARAAWRRKWRSWSLLLGGILRQEELDVDSHGQPHEDVPRDVSPGRCAQ